MLVTLSGIVMEVRNAQFVKAEGPMVVTVLGILILWMEVPIKLLWAIVVTILPLYSEGMVTEITLVLKVELRATL